MRVRERLIIGIVFAILSIILALISTMTTLEVLECETLDLVVECGENIIPVNFSGITRFSGNIPEGVNVYLLTEVDYLIYSKSGELPNTYLSSKKREVYITNPSYIIIKSTYEGCVKLKVEVFKVVRSYAFFSFLAYPLGLLSLVFIIHGIIPKKERK